MASKRAEEHKPKKKRTITNTGALFSFITISYLGIVGVNSRLLATFWVRLAATRFLSSNIFHKDDDMFLCDGLV